MRLLQHNVPRGGSDRATQIILFNGDTPSVRFLDYFSHIPLHCCDRWQVCLFA